MKAFPLQIEHFEDYEDHPQKGMDLRDYFAGLAMQGMFIHHIEHDLTLKEVYKLRAESAYRMADAMMEARDAK